MNLTIRSATESDFNQVGKIFAEENRFHANLQPHIFRVIEPIMTPEWYNEILSNPNKSLFVAALEKEITGLALVIIKTNPDDPLFQARKYAYLDELAVGAPYRGQGVGRLLMRQVHHWTLAHNVAEIELNVWENNPQAISFYEKLGYEATRRTMRFDLGEA